MRRREFVTLLGGAAVAWSLTARAQQPDRLRRIGGLVSRGMEVDDLDTQTRIGAFRQGLEQLGWATATPFRSMFGRAEAMLTVFVDMRRN